MSFFQRLSIEQKLVGINVVLFLFIGGMAAMLMTNTYEVPAPPPIDLIDRRLEEIPQQTRTVVDHTARFQTFGEKDIFTAIIPLPTPTPTPEPTPVPDPSLEEAIRPWQLKGISAGYVFLEDPRTRKEWVMDIQDASTLTETIRFNNVDMVIKLESLDEIDSTAVFSYTGRQGKQEVTRGVYED